MPALDNLCQLAARTIGASIVIVVEWIDKHIADIRGASGTNVRRLSGSSQIPELRRAERPLMVFQSIRSEPWFAHHALYAIDPYATALVAADIAVPDTHVQAALVAFNPASRSQRDGTMIAAFSEFASIAGFLLAAAHDAELMGDGLSQPRPHTWAETLAGFRDNTSDDSGHQSTAEPLLFFLQKTLIKRRALRSFRSIHYVTLRRWKEAVKDAQIAALRAMKSRPSREAIEHIAAEVAEAAKEMYPGLTYSCVVPVPCGSSPSDRCLSVLVSEAVAKLLQVPLKCPLQGERTPGASHPHKSAKLKHYEVLEAVSGSILLIDDVATSGTHIALAAMALRSSGATPFPFVWIGK